MAILVIITNSNIIIIICLIMTILTIVIILIIIITIAIIMIISKQVKVFTKCALVYKHLIFADIVICL